MYFGCKDTHFLYIPEFFLRKMQKDVKVIVYPHGSHLNGLMPNRDREKKLNWMIPIIGLMNKTFGKYRKDNLRYFEESEKEIIDWIMH